MAAMKPFLALCLTITAISAPVHATAMAQERARVEGGIVEGMSGRRGDVRVFLGIPYAAPPVGALRWRRPEPVIPWQGIRKANKYGSDAIQFQRASTEINYEGPQSFSEDCLYLNVWTPKRAGGQALPVLLWIHGGGFEIRSGKRPFYDGEELSRKGAVVVTFNYRLNLMGFFAHPELARESAQGISGNYGLYDIIAAFEWVRRNIAAFGGDPERVSIFGESAGSVAASLLTTSPLTRQHINGAITQSVVLPWYDFSLSEMESDGVKLAQAAAANSIADLRRIPAEELLQLARKADLLRFVPVVDQVAVLKFPFEAVQDGAGKPIPILTGWNADEGANLTMTMPREQYVERNRRAFGDLAQDYLNLYPAQPPAELARSIRASLTDRVAWQHLQWAELNRRNGSSVFVYRFSRAQPQPAGARYRNPIGLPLPEDLGAFHEAEIPYVFNSLALLPNPWQESDHRLADMMSSYWVNFAATGNPNGPGLPDWPMLTDKATSSSAAMLNLDAVTQATPLLLSEPKRRLWHDYYHKDPGGMLLWAR